MRTTLKDVAQEAGVSVTLISKFLNNNPSGRMSPETRKRIEAALKRLNYRPSELARSLKIGKSGTIGVVLSNLANPHFGSMADMVLREAKKAGYQLLISLCDYGREEEQESLNSLINRQVDGIIYMEHIYDSPLIAKFAADGFPLVSSNSEKFSSAIIKMNDAQKNAVDFLVRNGAGKIVIVYNIYTSAPDENLRQVYPDTEFSFVEVMPAAEERKILFRQICREKPDAVILPGGYSTLIFFKVLKDEFPDYSPMMISCTNAAKMIPRAPGLVGIIKRDFRKSAESMVRLVCDRINGKPIERVVIPAEFIKLDNKGDEDELF